MSIAGILSSIPFSSNSQAVTSSRESFQKEFQQLGEALQSGNLSAARQDFSNIQRDLPGQGTQASHHRHHHFGGGGGSGEQSNIVQEFAQLGQDLQAGNVSSARQAYSEVQQSFAAFGANASAATLSSVV